MYIVNYFCSELHYWKEWRIKASSILKSWRVNALVQTQKHNLQWHFQGVTVIFTFRKLNISNNRLDHQTLTLVLWLSKKYKVHQSDKKGSTPHEALCLNNSIHIQRGRLWLYHQNTHKYTLELRWEPGFHWITTQASTPTRPNRGNRGLSPALLLEIYSISGLSGGLCLCKMLPSVSAVIFAEQHQPCCLSL